MSSDLLSSLEVSVAKLSEEIASMTVKSPIVTRDLTTSTITELYNSGDAAWVLISAAFGLFMTMPGVAIYYSGMLRTKNVLSTIMQCFTICCVTTFLWLAFSYSLAMGPAETIDTKYDYIIYGSADRTWLLGMFMNFVPTGSNTADYGSYHYLAPTLPEPAFVVYQMMFAILAGALTTGAFASRMKYAPMILFTSIWHIVVYCPLVHSIRHQDGFLNKYGVLDYSGGDFVFISSGVSGLVAAIVLGHRKGYGKEKFDPHNIVLTFIGMSIMWVGWYGLCAGSAYSASFRAGYAMLATQISASFGALAWMGTEWFVTGSPTVHGMMSGCIAGLIAISPASGYVDQTGAASIGMVAGPLCFFGAKVKKLFGYDDALDAFGVNAIAGIIGGIATGFFANPDICGSYGVYYGSTFTGGRQLAAQLYGIAVSVGWSAVATFVILKLVEATVGLRVSEAEEEAGLDVSLHGESLDDGFSKAFLSPTQTYEPSKSVAEDKADPSADMDPVNV